MRDPESSLDGACVVVTGAGSGIGREMARLFAARGSRVVAVDIAADRLDAAGFAGEWTPAVADISDPAAAARVIEMAAQAYGPPRALLNNAGILDRLLPVHETPDDVFDRVMAVNLKAAFLLARAALPLMIEAGEGVIVNTSSVAGLRGGRGGATYTISKHALIGLTRSIAAHYQRFGIRCVALAPGAVNTGIPHGGADSELGASILALPNSTRVGRRIEPQEIAELAYFAASPEASPLNGAVLEADRGWLSL